MVDRELYEAYSRALATLSDAAEAELRRVLAEYETLERDRDYVAAAALYHRIVGRFGRVASEVAREFYQRQRDASDLDSDYVAQQAPEIPGGFCAQDATEARAMSSAAAEWLVGRGSRRVMENADFTIGYNARRDPAHPMWAVVPHPGACGFCVMVASNGWFMAKRPVNAQRHSHCKCSVVADFDVDNPALEGYDPDALQEAYSRCEETVRDEARRRWDRMSPEERRGYARKGRGAYDVFKTKMTVEELNRRDRSWIQDPTHVAKVSKDVGAHPLEKEMVVARRLASQGFNVHFIREVNRHGEKTADAYLNDEVWEFKVPESYNEKTVKNQMKKALGKGTGRLLISCTENMADATEVADGVESLFERGEFMGITEVMIMSADGSITRVMRA